MDKKKATTIDNRIMEHIKSLEKELGVTFSRSGGRYDDVSLSFKITATESDADGNAQDKDAMEFKRYASSLGLKPSDLGRKITCKGSPYAVCGAQIRNRKFPIIVAQVGNPSRKMKMSAAAAKILLDGR